MTELLLNITAIITIICSIFVITANNPVSIVVFLIAVFIIAACYLLLIGLGFIGLSYLIVYVGAVAVLFLFVVIILNVRLDEIITYGSAYTQNLPLGFIICVFFSFEIISVINPINQNFYNIFIGIFHTLNEVGINFSFTNSFSSFDYSSIISLQNIIFVNDISQIQALGINLYGHGAF